MFHHTSEYYVLMWKSIWHERLYQGPPVCGGCPDGLQTVEFPLKAPDLSQPSGLLWGEMKMVNRNVCVVRGVGVGGGCLASWLARCNHGHYLMELEEIGWAESSLLPVMEKMTPLSLCQSIPYSPERPINKTKEGFWARTHRTLRRNAARNVKYAQIPTWTWQRRVWSVLSVNHCVLDVNSRVLISVRVAAKISLESRGSRSSSLLCDFSDILHK